MTFESAARILAEARMSPSKLDKYPKQKPINITQAYDLQDQVTKALELALNSQTAGWKIGITSKSAQDIFNVQEPICSAIIEAHIHHDGAHLEIFEYDLKFVEPEIGFRMKHDLPPRAEPYSRSDIVGAIESLCPLFELATKRLPGQAKDDIEWIIADGALNQAMVVGANIAFSSEMNMCEEQVEAYINGKLVSTGSGKNALGDPINVLVWLTNHLSARGKTLKSGELIATGLICDMLIAETGATMRADFSSIGSVSMHIKSDQTTS